MSEPIMMDEFFDWGLRGLYGGETAADIARRKGLTRWQDIFDWMNSDELAANAERAQLAALALRARRVRDPRTACCLHYEAGVRVRERIQAAGGVLPEQQPTPEKSCVQLRWELDPGYRDQMN